VLSVAGQCRVTCKMGMKMDTWKVEEQRDHNSMIHIADCLNWYGHDLSDWGHQMIKEVNEYFATVEKLKSMNE